MIPPFHDSGVLPSGVHAATPTEIDDRFGRGSEIRRVQMESVRWMVEIARRAGVERIVLNGRFVPDTMEPNDVDCVLLVGRGFPREGSAERELRAGLPLLEIELVRRKDFEKLVNVYFATDTSSTSLWLRALSSNFELRTSVRVVSRLCRRKRPTEMKFNR